MVCVQCGNELPAGARFCSHCGAAVYIAPVQPMTAAPYYIDPAVTRVSRHIQTLGVMWAIYAAWRLITKLVGMVFAHAVISHMDINGWGPFGGSLTHMWLPAAIMSLLFSTGLCIVTAYALLHRLPWGRVFAIVTAVLMLIHPLLGTALGIYTLWVLAPSLSGAEYDSLTAAPQQS